MKKILFVDDEVQILKALNRVLIDSEYEVFTVDSGKRALEFLESDQVDLVITDMRMPHMDGYELLSQIKGLYPRIIRIILSGYSDEKVVFKALQKNIAKLYVMKPWDNDKLLIIIDQIFKMEEMLTSANLLTLINGTEHLPTIEESYQRILNLIEKESDLSLIAQEIERDQSICSKILHVANSAYYNARTGSIKQAVTYIGLQNTKNLVLSTSIIEGFKSSHVIRDQVEEIWNHAFITNKILNFIYIKQLNKKLPETLSTVGLLHNIGLVLFLSNFGQEYLRLLKTSRTEKKDITLYEQEQYSVTHNEAGSYLLNWWEFPYEIVEAAMYHHSPMHEKIINRELVCALHIAQRYAWGIMKTEAHEEFDLRAFEALNVTQVDFEKIFEMFKL